MPYKILTIRNFTNILILQNSLLKSYLFTTYSLPTGGEIFQRGAEFCAKRAEFCAKRAEFLKIVMEYFSKVVEYSSKVGPSHSILIF